jgi:hypothetical protein
MAEEIFVRHVLRVKTGDRRDVVAPGQLAQSVLPTLDIEKVKYMTLELVGIQVRGSVARKASNSRATGGCRGVRSQIEIDRSSRLTQGTCG